MKNKNKIGIKTSFKVFTFAVFLLSIISAYFLYSNYNKYKDSDKLLKFVNLSDTLSTLMINISNEKIESNIYAISKTSIPYLKNKLYDSRLKTDNSIEKFLSIPDNNLINLKKELNKIQKIRQDIDKFKVEDNYFDKVTNIILEYQKKALQFSYLKELKEELNENLAITRAINRNIIENSTVSLYIILDKPIPEDVYTKMKRDIISIDKSLSFDLLSFDVYKGIDKKLYKIVREDLVENRKIVDYLNLTYYNVGEFDGWIIDVIDWSSVLQSHIDILNKIKSNINDYIINKSVKIKNESIQILIISAILFILSILLQIWSYFIQKGVQKSIDSLSELLNSLASIAGKDTSVDVSTNEGQSETFHIIEDVINQLNEQRLKAQSASKAKSLFLANMSHEIRTPINGIMGFIDILKTTPITKEQLEYLTTIEVSSKNLLSIINKILDISKIESGKMDLFIEEFKPCEEFEDTIKLFVATTKQEGLKYAVYIDPKMPKILKTDTLKIKEVLYNLIGNAIKFTSKGGEIAVQVVFRGIYNNKAKIYFEVKDTGIGMTQEQIEQIFQPFTQADESTTKKYGGTGLGLAISNKYIEMLGSKIELESEYERGAKFYFELEMEVVDSTPYIDEMIDYNLDIYARNDSASKTLMKYLDSFGIYYRSISSLNDMKFEMLFLDKELDENEIKFLNQKNIKIITFDVNNLLQKLIYHFDYPLFPKEFFEELKDVLSKNKHLQLNPFRYKKALVVEDNEINYKLLNVYLEELEIESDLALSGLEAVDMFKENRYSFVFMDLALPEFDGIEATRRIREYEISHNIPKTPIIAITSNLQKDKETKFFEAGGDEFLRKPLSQSKLISALSNVLSRGKR